MGARFGRDFGHVQVHADAQAADAARAVGAVAFTVGPDIVLGAGRYEPNTAPGRWLLAHELSHVAQQEGATELNSLSLASHANGLEREAGAAATAATLGGVLARSVRPPPSQSSARATLSNP